VTNAINGCFDLTRPFSALCLIVVVSLGGCGGIRTYPEAPFDMAGQLESTRFAFEQATFDRYSAATGSQKLLLRNEIINAQIRAYDIKFQEYEQNLSELGIGLGIGTDWASLALSGLTATVGGTTTKAAFGAVNAGIVGAKGAIDKHLFMEKTMPVLMTEMASQRTAVLVQIRAGLEQDLSKYDLQRGLGDVRRYAEAGSIVAALKGITSSSGSELKKNVDELNKLTTFTYQKDAAGDKLQAFWMPDGKTPDPNNTKRLMEEMAKRGLATGPGRIANFITGKEFAPLRAEIAKALGL
jgi:hypothetical protein